MSESGPVTSVLKMPSQIGKQMDTQQPAISSVEIRPPGGLWLGGLEWPGWAVVAAARAPGVPQPEQAGWGKFPPQTRHAGRGGGAAFDPDITAGCSAGHGTAPKFLADACAEGQRAARDLQSA